MLNMQTFTGWQYLLIDAANSYGLDKLTYAERLEWAETNLKGLETFVDEAESPALYLKAVQAIRKVQRGEPTGHLVGFDAVCSGMQLMSVMTGCKAGAAATGLVDPDRRADAYTEATRIMSDILGKEVSGERSKVKKAVMTVLYASEKQPEMVFGKGTPELAAFYEMLTILCPGAYELLQDLKASWDPEAKVHTWKLPDGFDAYVPVIDTVESRIEVQELGGASFTFQFKENKPLPYGRSTAANVVHSVDAYVLRSLIRRCSYSYQTLQRARKALQMRLEHPKKRSKGEGMVKYLIAQYERSGMPDTRIFAYLDEESVFALEPEHCRKLLQIAEMMKCHRPFHVVSIHDEFKCHANNMNWLRWHYREILAEIAESKLVDDLLSQLYGVQGTFPRKSLDLADYIRRSNYAIC